MDEVKLYELVDFILNRADSQELDVIRAALRRRESPAESRGAGFKPDSPMGIDIDLMARNAASSVNEQLGTSQKQIRDMVTGFVRDMIQKEAPEISENQLNNLLEEWVPKPGQKKAAGKAKNPLPSDVYYSMIRQFVSFSTGAMTVSEENALKLEIPDWHSRYWEKFSPGVRRLVSLFLKGALNSDDFWQGISSELESS